MSPLKIAVNAEDHALGDADAPATLVEYGDYQCPHCDLAVRVVERLRRHFGARLRFVFRHFPMSQLHAGAQRAAEVAEFAGSKGKFWEMHEALFEHQDRLEQESSGMELYLELAGELGLDAGELRDALDSGMFRERVREEFSGGVRSGVNGTPTYFVNGQRVAAREYDALVLAIEAVLAD